MTTKATTKDRFEYTSSIEQTPAGPITFYKATDPVTSQWVGVRVDAKRRFLTETGEVQRTWTGRTIRVGRTDKRIYRELAGHLTWLTKLDASRQRECRCTESVADC